jgi:SAM-dependent methyltransferase
MTLVVRRLTGLLRKTPFHPQWLMGGNESKIRALRQKAKGTVLDIGCSTRWIEDHLPLGCVYIALDYPATGLAMYGSRPDVFADASRLPFGNDSLDTVVLFETLEHIADPIVAISEAFRVLKPGGYLLLTVPFLYPLHDEPFDFTRFTSHGLRKELDRAGFHVEHILPSLGSAESAGLIVSLSLGGMTLQAFRKRSFSIVFSPLLLLSIPVVNLVFWAIGKLMPSWSAMPAGYHALARK